MANPKRWPIGLQSSVTGRPQGIGEVIKELTRHNIAFFSASTDSFSILADLQTARAANPEVPHTANFTLTGYWPREEDQPNRYHLNVPEYTKRPSEEVARRHWDMVEKREPINDPARSPINWQVPCIWISTWNEIRDYVGWHKQADESKVPSDVVDGFEGNADIVGWHAVEVGKEAVRRGYRWAAFGFSGGSPEEGFWEAPGMLAYLRLCEQHPDQLGVALHEYSLADSIINRPDHIGRFKMLHAACDRHGIRRPVIQFKEFGWRDIEIPHDQAVAMRELIEVAAMYAEHPNIHGAALWTVHPWQGSNIHNQVAALIPHLRDAALQHAREIPPLRPPAMPAPSLAAATPAASQPAAPTPDKPKRPKPAPPSSAAQALAPEFGTVSAPDGLNLRTEPSTAAQDESIIDRLELGTRVEILGRVNDWYHVRVNGKTGFVSSTWVALVPPPDAPPQGAGPAVAREGFQPGVNVNPGVHPADIDRLRGLSWVRYVFIAADRKQTIDEAFHATYGPLARAYADVGIGSLIILNHETAHGNKPWINGDWAAYAEEYGRAARRVAELLAPLEDRIAFQIWNEQDSGWGDDARNPNPSARGVTPEAYALLLHAASRNIREVAPQATIVTGGLKTGPDNGTAYLAEATRRLGGRLPVDAIAYHPYGRYVNTDPFYGRKHGTLPAALAVFRQKFPDYPLWITEIGIPGHENPIGPEHYANIALYMNEFTGEVANRHAGHVPVLIWFAWTDRMENAGILTADGQEKRDIFPAFLAMKARGVRSGGKNLGGLESALESLEAGLVEMGKIIAPAGLNLRTEPSTQQGDASIKTRLLENTMVEILEKLAGWYKVRAGELEGYVSADWVSVLPQDARAAMSTPAHAPRKTRSVVGIHGAPGGAAPPPHLWDMWTDKLTEMGIRWYKQCETTDDTGPGSIFQWARHLKQKGIEPIIRYLMSGQFPSNLEDRFFRQMERYAAEDIRWAELGNEPNLAYEWQDSWRGRYEGQWPDGQWAEEPRMRWGNPESIETLARVWVQDANRAADLGAWPAFYAFGPTDWGSGRPHGHYSSSIFTDRVVARLASHHRADTIRLFRQRKAWIAVHVAKYEHGFDFNPFDPQSNKWWDMSLRGYEVVLNAFRRHFGGDLDVGSVPIISTEGGVFVPDHRNSIDSFRLPANDEEHARQIVEMFRYVEQHTPLMAMCPWCIAEGHQIIGHGTDLFRHHGWFKEENGHLVERPVYQAMRRLRQESEKSVSLADLAEDGLESVAVTAPQPETGAAVTVTITLRIEVRGDVDPNNVVVNVKPRVE